MECVDSRRLTGPNLLWDRRGAVLDVRCDADRSDAVIEAWRRQVRRMLDAVGWQDEQTCVRRFSTGASLAISAPRDGLYAATDVNDWAWDAACAVLAGEPEPQIEPDAEALRRTILEESNPPLTVLQDAALEHGLPLLSDDDAVSIGLGKGSRTWPVDALPSPADIDWTELHTIPLGLVTGTNGKTTSVRLMTALARSQGLTVGLSSTDWIAVDDDIIDLGDYSGPGGARQVLRDTRVEIAVLETARGGLLRRGLAVEQADAALITNVASDHLGEFGVEELASLADVKWVVSRALGERGCLILNAGDPLLVERARTYNGRLTWFSRDPGNPVLRAGLAAGHGACTVEDGHIVYLEGDRRDPITAVDSIPITLGGAATHNVDNALGVAGLALALGLSIEAVASGLQALRPEQNPGRCNLFNIGGARVIVDFAHNPHGLQAFLELGRNLSAERRLLIIGQAGDRSDDDIKSLVEVAARANPDRVLIKRMARYSRGRPDGEVARLIRETFLAAGTAPDKLVDEEDELEAVRDALRWAQPGDLVIALVHEDRNAVLDFLTEQAGGG